MSSVVSILRLECLMNFCASWIGVGFTQMMYVLVQLGMRGQQPALGVPGRFPAAGTPRLVTRLLLPRR